MSKRKLSAGYNLALKFPHLAQEWHPTRNGTLKPADLLPHSNKKVWWICEKGHEWKAEIKNRTKGFGCPYCAGQRALPANNLAVKFSDLAKQWHPTRNGELTPWSVTPKSNKIGWWRCQKGHEWKSSVHNRASGTACPYCAGKRVCDDNNLAVKRPELAKQWHPTKNGDLRPDLIVPGSSKKVWWLCEKGHEWEAVASRRSTGVGCPYCAGKKVTEDYNLAVKFPELTKEWHPTKNRDLKPSDVLPGSDKKVWWICAKGHEWETPVGYRTSGSGCPNCSGTRVTTLNNLAVTFPMIARQWHPDKNGPLTPDQVKAGSDKKVWWTCPKGHEWERRVMQQVRSGTCPICASVSRKRIR